MSPRPRLPSGPSGSPASGAGLLCSRSTASPTLWPRPSSRTPTGRARRWTSSRSCRSRFAAHLRLEARRGRAPAGHGRLREVRRRRRAARAARAQQASARRSPRSAPSWAVRRELGLTWLESDIDVDGGKLYLAAGAPSSTGADEERMLRALRAILDEGSPLTLRAGVNRGPVFAGDIGASARRTYAVMGDTVNLAARLAARAEPGRDPRDRRGARALADPLRDRSRSRSWSRARSARSRPTASACVTGVAEEERGAGAADHRSRTASWRSSRRPSMRRACGRARWPSSSASRGSASRASSRS